MAKYTDPNTGVKYSTHTGLKVFAVIVVILLVISIVFNVVFIVQGSDGSETDSELDEQIYSDGDGDGDGENSSGVLSNDGDENEESDEDDDNLSSTKDGSEIIDEPEKVENEKVANVGDTDENGVAECTFFYDDCSICTGVCEGHDMYLTLGGGVYEFYPYSVTIGAVSMTSSEEEIQVSLIFDEVPERKDNFLNVGPVMFEIGSLTGDALDIESIELSQDLTYTVEDYAAVGEEYVASYPLMEVATSVDSVKIYEMEREYDTFGRFTLFVETAGDGYAYEFNFIDDADLWSGLLTDEQRWIQKETEEAQRRNQDYNQGVANENDWFVAKSETDENGITEGKYYYYRCTICNGDDGSCAGHAMYKTSDGAYYEFYPHIVTLTLTDEDGSADINSEMRFSLVFEEEIEYEGDVVYGIPVQMEIVSLSGDDLEIDSMYLQLYDRYNYIESNDCVDITGDDKGTSISFSRTFTVTATAKNYEIKGSEYGSYSLTLNMKDGSVYSCEFYIMSDSQMYDALAEGRYNICK